MLLLHAASAVPADWHPASNAARFHLSSPIFLQHPRWGSQSRAQFCSAAPLTKVAIVKTLWTAMDSWKQQLTACWDSVAVQLPQLQSSLSHLGSVPARHRGPPPPCQSARLPFRC